MTAALAARDAARGAWRECAARREAFDALLAEGGAVAELEALSAAQTAAILAAGPAMQAYLGGMDLRPVAGPVEGRLGHEGLAALEKAAKGGHLHLVDWLLPLHAGAGGCGALALSLLCRELQHGFGASRPEVVRRLFRRAVACGADVNACGEADEIRTWWDSASLVPVVHSAVWGCLYPSYDPDAVPTALRNLAWVLAQPQASPAAKPHRPGARTPRVRVLLDTCCSCKGRLDSL